MLKFTTAEVVSGCKPNKEMKLYGSLRAGVFWGGVVR